MKLSSAVINKNALVFTILSGWHGLIKQLCSDVFLALHVDLAQTKAIFRKFLCGTSLGKRNWRIMCYFKYLPTIEVQHIIDRKRLLWREELHCAVGVV